jgi:acetyltransferase-like isoleucine patch superfamily enzyme
MLDRLRRRIAALERPLPRALTNYWLARRFDAYVDPRADIRFPASLTLGRGTRLGRCRIICTGPVSLGERCDVRDDAIIDAQCGPVTLGRRVGVNPFCILYGAGGLTIGDDVLIAAHTVVIPSNHRFERNDVPIWDQGTTQRGVRIGSDVWLGTHVVVLDGVRIGDGAVVAAGAVVARDVEPRTIVGGVPARVLRDREPSAGGAP